MRYMRLYTSMLFFTRMPHLRQNGNALSAIDFVCSEGAEEGLRYPMHLMVRDVNGHAAYGYLDDIDVQPEIQIVHVGEDEST